MQCNEEHNEQLVAYLRFLRRKRDAAIAEVAAEFNETKDNRLFDDMSYSCDDVTAILDGLLGVVRATMKRDLQTTAFSSVLLVKQAFEQAEEHGFTLSTDMPSTEHRQLLEAVEQWDQDVHGGGTAAPLRARAAMPSRPAARALPVIGQAQDPKLLADLQSSRDDNATLQERFNRLQLQCSAALREKSAAQAQLDAVMGQSTSNNDDSSELASLRMQVEQLHDELDAARGAKHEGSGVDMLMQELQELQDANSQITADLDAARAEVSARVERSTQFVNMRQMLAKKNLVVRQLREQLQAHGIFVDDVDAADD